MAGPTAVTDTEHYPTHDVVLSDGTNSVGFVFCDANGQPNPNFERIGMPSDALLASQGQSEYSNYEPGYMRIEQSDWSGGRGLNDLDKDKTRYYDGRSIYPVSDGIIPGPMIHYANGFNTENKYLPDDIPSTEFSSTISLHTTSRYYASDNFDPGSANYNALYAEFWVKKNGTPGTLTVSLYESSSGTPTGSALRSATMTASNLSDITWEYVRVTLSSAYTLDNTKEYHVVFIGASTDTSTNCYDILVSTSAGGSYGSNGSSWSTDGAVSPYYRVRATSYTGSVLFVEYKRATYAITQPDSGQNSFLWMNGDRGAADSNTGVLTTLVDATKSWTADEWIGCKVVITNGPGAEEAQPWRTITDNDGTTLTVSPTWNITHTTSTEYVILGSDKWSVVAQDFGSGSADGDLRAYCTDACVAGDYMYIARGDTGSNNVIRFQAYNAAGTWSMRDDTENVEARSLCAIRHPEDDTFTIYGSIHDHTLWGACIWKGVVPKAWGDLYRDYGVVFPTEGLALHDTVGANITLDPTGENLKLTVTDTFATGTLVIGELAATVNLLSGSALGVMVYSTHAMAAADLEIQIDDDDALASPTDYDLPAVAADTWTWATIDMPSMTSATEEENYQKVNHWGLNVDTDHDAAYSIYLQGGIHLISDVLEYIDMPNHVRINKILPYGGSATEPRKNPWVITEDSIYEIQTQNDDAVVPIPLDEITALRGADNGQSSGVNDVYLYFNLGRKFERYYSRNLDDVGPDLDDGMPTDRQGILSGFVSYPGKVLVSVDTMSSGVGGGHSTVMMLNGNAWHELYRSHTLTSAGGNQGTRFRGLGFQSIPGSMTGRLWFRMHEALCWIPVSLNAYTDPDYSYTYESILESPWMYAGTKGIKKAWKSMTLFCDRTSAAHVFLDYKVDDESDSWTVGTTDISTSTITETDFAASISVPVGYRIKYRLRMLQSRHFYVANTLPVHIRAIVVNCYGIAPIKHGYSWMGLLKERGDDKDLNATPQNALGYNDAAETALAKVDAWAQALTPLTMSSRYSTLTGKTVLLKDPRIMLKKNGINSAAQREEYLLVITVHDL